MKYEFTIGNTKVEIEGEDVTVAVKKIASVTSVAPPAAAQTSNWWTDGVPGINHQEFRGLVNKFERQIETEQKSAPDAQAYRPRSFGVEALKEWASAKHGRGSMLVRELGVSRAALYNWKRIPSKRAASISKITGISLARLLRESAEKPVAQAAE